MSMPNTIPPSDEAGLRIWLERLRGEVARLEAKIGVLEDKVRKLEVQIGGE